METLSETPSVECLNLLVLVPHRDCLPALRAYGGELFAAGFDGAYSFPPVSPLGAYSRPLTGTELKGAAAGLRALLGGAKLRGGKGELSVPLAGPSAAPAFRLYGPALPGLPPVLPPPGLPPVLPPPLCRWAPPVLACALLAPSCPLPDRPPAPPEFSFRAAALANLRLLPLTAGEQDYSFQWQIGRLFWLPKPERNGGAP